MDYNLIKEIDEMKLILNSRGIYLMFVGLELELVDSHRVYRDEHHLDNLQHRIRNCNQQYYVDNSENIEDDFIR